MLKLKSSNMDFDFVVDIVDATVVDVVAVVGGADCGSGVIVVVI